MFKGFFDNNETDEKNWVKREKQIKRHLILIFIAVICLLMFITLLICDILIWQNKIVSIITGVGTFIENTLTTIFLIVDHSNNKN